MGEIDFRALFGALPSPHMILDRDFRYVDANAAYERVVEVARDALIGHGLFELFPNPGEGGRMLRASLQRVLDTGQPDTLALIPYAIPLALSRGGQMEMRYWSAVHTPLFDDDGQVAHILQNTVDVTELQRLKAIAYGPAGAAPGPGETALLQRVQEVQALNRSLAQETSELRDLFMQAPGFIAVLTGPELTFTLVNTAYQQLIGHRPVIGLPVADALPEVREQGFVDLLQEVMETRTPFIGRAVSVLLQRTPEGEPEERFLDFIYQPILGAEGAAVGVFVEGSDVTARVQAEEQQTLLLDELNHRVKNTLATVQSIAAQTLRINPDPEAFRDAFEARILALSATHDILTASNWRRASLRDVLAVEFRPFGAERYELSGPPVALTAEEALTLGLLTHELATNAAKYGALSTGQGRVSVRWQVTDEGRLELIWCESGGPPVSVPTRRGFGSRLIERSLKGKMAGQALLDFRPDGLCCSIGLPLAEAEA